MPIERTASGTTITGNAINWFGVQVVLSAMGLYLKTGMMANRNYTPANMRAFAERYTGKTYARSKKGLILAHNDLAAFVNAQKPDDVPAR